MVRNFGAALAVRVARVLYRRWEALPPLERKRLEGLAEDVKQQALDLRGAAGPGNQEERELELAADHLAEAMGAEEVADIRAQLRRELERMELGQRRRPAA